MREHRLSDDNTHLRYPPLRRLTEEEHDEARRSRGVPEDVIAIDVQKRKIGKELLALKGMLWRRRKNMLVAEVLAGSDASEGERQFLLGSSDIDPSPTHEIVYEELVPGEEINFAADSKDYPPLSSKPKGPRPLVKPSFAQVVVGEDQEAQKLVTKLSGGRIIFDPSIERNRLASVEKQRKFRRQVEDAFIPMVNASTAYPTEITVLQGVGYRYGSEIHYSTDHSPEHQITYRRLVPKSSLEQPQTDAPTPEAI